MTTLKPAHNCEEIHKNLVDLVRLKCYIEPNISDRELLQKLISNYRTGGGLRLSDYGFELCIKFKLYEFSKFSVPFEDKFSTKHDFYLDRLCSTPYHIDHKNYYISDPMIITALTFCSDDFEGLVKTLT